MKSVFVSTMALIAGAGLAGTATAQEAERGDSVMDTIVITAQKYEQDIEDVGIAVTAFSGDQLQSLWIKDSTDLTMITPGLRNPKSNSGFTSSFSLRGLSQSDYGASQEAPVALYVDEVYQASQGAAQFLLFDLDRVEVLRGPQGTLFGRNATGGVVHYVTQKPTQTPEGYVQGTYGRFNDRKIESAINTPITDTISARISVAGHWMDAIAENRIGPDMWDADEYGGRAQILFEPSSDVSFLLNIRGSKRSAMGQPYDWAAARPTGFAGTGQFTPGLTDNFGFAEPDTDPLTTSINAPSHNDANTYGVSGTLSWDLGWATLTSISDYNHVDVDFVEDSDMQPGEYFHFFGLVDSDQISQEIRLNGGGEGFRWVTGAYYLNVDGDYVQSGRIHDLGFGVDVQDTVYDVQTDSASVFGQVEFDLTDQVSAILGARYVRERKTQNYLSQFKDVVGGTPVAFGSSPDLLRFNGRSTDGLYAARAELDWKPTDDVLLYASYNRGVKGGGFNAPLDPSGAAIFIDPTTFDPAPTADAAMRYEPETLNSYELGLKATLLDGLARVHLAAFYYDYQDFQAYNFSGISTQYITNRDAKLQGIDAELYSSPIDGLDLVFGASYLDQVVYDVPVGPLTLDRKMPYAPEWNLTALARYEWAFLDGTLAVQANANYVSEQYLGLSNADVLREPSYTLANARTTYTFPGDQVSVSLFVDNITDETYRTLAFDLSGFLGSVESQTNLPRTYGISLNYAW